MFCNSRIQLKNLVATYKVAHRRYDFHCRAFLCDSIALWFMERVGFLTSLRNSWGGDGRWGAVGSGPDGQLRTQRGQFVFDLTLVTEDCGHIYPPGFHHPWGSRGTRWPPVAVQLPILLGAIEWQELLTGRNLLEKMTCCLVFQTPL